jgi:ATP-dependent Clp protease protease subunit
MKKASHDHEFEMVLDHYNESYLKLSKSRIIFINQPIDYDISSTLSALLFYYDHQSQTEDIIMYINSVGGNSAALSNIYDVMQMIQSPIKTICLAKCYSAAAVMLAAGAKGKRYCFKNSEVMIHGLQCSFPTIDNTSKIDSEGYLQFLNDHNNQIMKILARHTGKSFAEIREDCKKDVFLSPKEAIAYGLADHII